MWKQMWTDKIFCQIRKDSLFLTWRVLFLFCFLSGVLVVLCHSIICITIFCANQALKNFLLWNCQCKFQSHLMIHAVIVLQNWSSDWELILIFRICPLLLTFFLFWQSQADHQAWIYFQWMLSFKLAWLHRRISCFEIASESFNPIRWFNDSCCCFALDLSFPFEESKGA